jgi:hypothetical protein
MRTPRGRLLAAAAIAAIAGCAGLAPAREVWVEVAGLEPLPGQGMEGRFLLRLRVQNPNEAPIEYDGIAVELEVRGQRLASGVSDGRGTVTRFGETVIAVPVSVPVSALVRQALGVASGSAGARADYRLRGRLAGPAFGGASFESRGELALPPGLGGGPSR